MAMLNNQRAISLEMSAILESCLNPSHHSTDIVSQSELFSSPDEQLHRQEGPWIFAIIQFDMVKNPSSPQNYYETICVCVPSSHIGKWW